MIRRRPESMETEEAVKELTGLLEEIRSRGQRVHSLAQAIHHKTRRSEADDTTAVYLAYANIMSRYGGAIVQVTDRTARSSRVLKQLPEKGPEKLVEPTPVEVETTFPSSSPVESLLSLYSEGIGTQGSDV